MKQVGQRLPRLDAIDMVRGLAIFFMIIVHTNAYFLSQGSKIVFDIWDVGEFSVPAFIFCAAYIFFRKNYPIDSLKGFFTYLKKRTVRLLAPYYIFAAVFISLILLHEPSKVTGRYIFDTFFVVGGIDLNWLVLLFLCFAVIMPFIRFISQKSRVLLYGLASFSVISAILLMFYHFPFNYRYIMWLPWSLLIIISMEITDREHERLYLLKSGALWFVVFLVSWITLAHYNHPLTMFDNKYPPNIYHLSFGAFSMIAIYMVAKKGIFSFFPIKPFLSFLSRNSYTLFFIHWAIIYVFWNFTHIQFDWISFFVVVLLSSSAVQIAINKVLIFVPKKQSG